MRYGYDHASQEYVTQRARVDLHLIKLLPQRLRRNDVHDLVEAAWVAFLDNGLGETVERRFLVVR